MVGNTEVNDKYNKIAQWFNETRNEIPFVEKSYFEFLIKILNKRSTILDLGCGTGKPIAQFFIEKDYELTGVDGSKEMIEICQKNFPDNKWILADMRTINLTQKFDCIVAWDSFFHLNQNDQQKMFNIFTQHLKPNGYLIFNTGHKHGEAWGEMEGEQFHHFSFSLEEYKNLLKEHNFEILKLSPEDKTCHGRTVWIIKYKNY